MICCSWVFAAARIRAGLSNCSASMAAIPVCNWVANSSIKWVCHRRATGSAFKPIIRSSSSPIACSAAAFCCCHWARFLATEAICCSTAAVAVFKGDRAVWGFPEAIALLRALSAVWAAVWPARSNLIASVWGIWAISRSSSSSSNCCFSSSALRFFSSSSRRLRLIARSSSCSMLGNSWMVFCS